MPSPRLRAVIGAAAMVAAGFGAARPAGAETAAAFAFDSIDGGSLPLSDWAGRPMLVVNTASRCGFTPQYAGLQALHDTYSARGLLVLAVPSDDFRQELASEAEVAEFCELNYDITLPMTTITHVKGADAHPFYKWVERSSGFTPGWNFNKVLIGPGGAVSATYGSLVKPRSGRITRRVEEMLQDAAAAGG
mgnify:CR=1 FL=1